MVLDFLLVGLLIAILAHDISRRKSALPAVEQHSRAAPHEIHNHYYQYNCNHGKVPQTSTAVVPSYEASLDENKKKNDMA